jgi:hypothetical protein
MSDRMKQRTTVLGLMGFIALVAVGTAGLCSDDRTWAAIVLALTVSALCTSTVAAIHRRGAWAGFAVFGWAFFLIYQPHSAPTVGATTLPMAMACRVVFYMSDPVKFPWGSFHISDYPEIKADSQGDLMLWAMKGENPGFRGLVPVNSLRAGLYLLNIGVGAIGAIVGGFIARHSVEGRGGDGRRSLIGE